MITIISGKPGAGKTALMTKKALEFMTQKRYEDKYKCESLLNTLNATGFQLSPPEHLVFANYAINLPFTDTWAYKTDPYYLGLPNTQHPVLFHPFGSHLFIDEGQKAYNSRMSKDFPDFASRYYEMHRQYDLDIYITAQREKLIDLNIREIAEHFIYIAALDVKKDSYGIIKRIVWHCYEFDDNAKIERWTETGEKRHIQHKTKYTYDGNIFLAYDNKGCFPLFLRDNYERNFDLEPHKPVTHDLTSIREYNDDNDIEIPETFYKKRAKK